MRKHLILAAACLVATLAQAAPIPSGHWQLGVTVRPCADLGQQPNTTYNPRYFDGEIYATQISGDAFRCFGRYLSGSGTFLEGAIPPVNEHRMIGRLRAPGGTNYVLGSGGAIGANMATFASTFTRYDSDLYASNPLAVDTIDTEVVESFDWVDNNTIISTCYISGQRNKLYLTDVTADPLVLTRNTTWNANGYVTTPVIERIRNVRVGQKYNGYAYYGDAGNNTNPNFYAIDLATGVSTLLGNAGTLTGGGSFGLWTVVERGGYLYVQTTDNGIQVYNMADATHLGSLYTTYTKAELDACTGRATTDQYYGFDVSQDGTTMLLGAALGNVFELQARVPVASGQWQLGVIVRPCADLGQQANTTYNPRYFDGEIYATQISGDAFRCFGRYLSGAGTFLGGAIPPVNEHRMIGRLRGPGGTTYVLGSGGAIGANMATFASTFTRYDSDLYASNPGAVDTIDTEVVESFDWVDDDTMISTCYISGQRSKLYLTDVTADALALTRNTTWNANGYVTTSVIERIRNVRVDQKFSGYAYYGDAGNNSSPNFYAINLTNGVSTLLGNAGTLTGGGSFGLWTVVERGGYLYVHTTDNGIQVYNMTDATTLGSLYTTYTKAELDACTGRLTADQYFGFDVSPDLKTILLGAALGNVFELAPALRLDLSRSGTDVTLSWPAYYGTEVVQSSSDLSAGFADMSPQPTVMRSGSVNTVIIPAGAGNTYFRVRKGP